MSTQDKSTYNNHTRLQHKSYKPYTCMISTKSITRVKEKSCDLGTSSVDFFRNPRRQDHPACNAALIFSSSTAEPPLLCTFDLILRHNHAFEQRLHQTPTVNSGKTQSTLNRYWIIFKIKYANFAESF